MPRALVVDDSRAVRMIVCRTLRELGYEVGEAGDGRQALEALGPEGSVDLILADWNMPEMDGLELLRAIRSNPAQRDIPVIMVTTEAEITQMVTALENGANEYIMKPFTKDILVDKLRLAGIPV
jgi:two-component system, chemotaxis family, chemotaxis protein CheY